MKLRLTLLYVGFIICLSLNGRIYADDSEDVDAEHENFEGQEAPGEVEKEKINFTKPVLEGKHHLVEFFDSVAAFKKTWIVSKSKKEEGDASVSKYDGVWSLEEPKTSVVNDDLALVLKSKAKHHAVSRYLEKPFEFNDKALVVQYEVKFQEGQECGGAYIKLLTKSDNLNLENFNDKTSYSIMFGPDKCGNDYKLHFIYRYKHPITGEFMEKHATKPSGNIDTYFNDKKSHLYTLVITPDNYYSIYVDQYQVKSGSLLTDVTPPLIPSKEIPDPNDKKPSDWDDNEKISDPHAVKPEDWDETQPEQIEDMGATQPDGWLTSEPSLIPDPVAEKPSDWDEDMDGEWEAPLISNPVCEKAPGCGEWKRPSIKNPLYKGKWTAPLIENPNYKGVWKANLIPNPDYFEEANPFQNLLPISAVGLELWSMSEDIAFDSFFISNDKAAADDFAAQTWQPKKAAEAGGAASSILQSVLDATHERPWLWAVIVVVIVLPVILLCAYCCFGSSSKSEGQVLHPKKTDETSPDDEVSEEELEEEEEEEEEDKHIGEGGDADALLTDTGEKKAKKLTKADLESKSVE